MPSKPTPAAPAEVCAHSVAEFCRLHSISLAYFYPLQARGIAPAVMKVGRRTLISKESAAEWRAKMTAATPQKASPASENDASAS